jgi:hypothetical protein
MNSWPAIQNTLKRVEHGPNPFERGSHISRRIHSMAAAEQTKQPRMNSWPAIQNTLKRVEHGPNPF